jgi:hypothetical protein
MNRPTALFMTMATNRHRICRTALRIVNRVTGLAPDKDEPMLVTCGTCNEPGYASSSGKFCDYVCLGFPFCIQPSNDKTKATS